MGRLMHTPTDKSKSAAEQITDIAKTFRCGATMRASHLVNLSLATMKWLVLNAESDDIRFKAADALLGLGPMQAKLGLMKDVVSQPYLGKELRPVALGKRLRAAMTTPEHAARILAMVEEAEKQSKAGATSPSKAA